MMGRVRHEILYVQAAEVFGRFCEGHFEHVSQKLTACPGITKPPPGTGSLWLDLERGIKKSTCCVQGAFCLVICS